MQFLSEKHALKAPTAKKAAAVKASTGRGANAQRKGAARLRSSSLAPVAEAEDSDAVAPAARSAGKAVPKVLAARVHGRCY